MAITLAQIIDAVEDTLDGATTVVRSQSYDELTEGVHPADMPLLQVYPEANLGVDAGGGTSDRFTFGGKGGDENTPLRQKEYAIHADYYAQQRSHIGEDMSALVDGIDAMETVLESQDVKNYFGLAGIRSFTWSWSRVTFVYGDPQMSYVGARFVINVRVF
ncbi:MAG: hypothetical protein GTO03_13470 [Planctomycetales bacterium]|nr:hypothetical protein [Planctomycetales bacterium]